ncbi:UDP-N-acetylmuramoyl-tripeptide--D-alanyl-D-alanine ligase [Paenibacillus sp. RC67]|uniref:UDP-N-acetylmuramoyl-tripeptide--D-alanyl-D- alanine ligase n=1 Tax=Paenibacillus sp. RC67 TaxID=3039392 RepID=UPI0024AC86F0|nr:UDP-N-acetylmuramoyl-tripeptide--D-alanyl-D-alanine ligase [Paenibacillus sp. RC67]
MTFKRPIIAITGSAGKTTTKEMLAAILQRKWKVFKSYQNGNNLWYTKQYKKQINSLHEAIVLEYGLKRAGDIKRLCQLLKPNIGMITNVGRAHIGNFNGRIKGIASAKSELIQNMPAEGTLYINKDDVHSKLLTYGGFKGKILSIGIKNKADYQATRVQYTRAGMRFQLRLNGKLQSFAIPVPGLYNVYNAIFAVAAAHRLGFTANQIQSGLMQFEKPYARLTQHRLSNGCLLINDSFNTKPELHAAVDVLHHSGKNRKIAVLGSIADMGKQRRAMHRATGRWLARQNLNYLYTFGPHARNIGLGAIDAGFSSAKVCNVTSMRKLKIKLMSELKPDSAILFKGATGGKVVLMHLVEDILRERG